MQLDALTMLTDTSEIHDLYETFSGGLAFDVGASGGTVANIFAEHFDQVVACEPSPEPFELMAKNVAGNVIPLEVAVSDVTGPVEFEWRQMSEGRGYYFSGVPLPLWGRETRKAIADAVTLDSLSERYGRPDLVKIDTEGHEVRVVSGGVETFVNRWFTLEFVIEVHSEAAGVELAGLLPPFRVVRHEAYEPGSPDWCSHYWMVSRAV